jgi:hypothetical protein
MLKKTDLLLVVIDLVNQLGVKRVAEKLNLAKGTVLRWIDLKNVPSAYQFDIMKMADIKIDYSLFSSKEKDQFFTSIETVKYCYDVWKKTILDLNLNEKSFSYIEPSAGTGAFLSVLPPNRTIAMDIELWDDKTFEQDFLQWKPKENNNYVVFGNPPFGLRGHLALSFINHSFEFSDFVCFILPQLFESDGKGSPRKRVKGYNLIHSEKINSNFYDPGGKETKINTIFQIWSKKYKNDLYEIKKTELDWLKIFSLSDGGTPSSTRNKKMLNRCDVYLPSTCFGKKNMICYNQFENLPGRKGYGLIFSGDKKEQLIQLCVETKWSDVSFLSTNSAYNLRMSNINNTMLDKYKNL